MGAKGQARQDMEQTKNNTDKTVETRVYGIVQGARIWFDWTVGGNRNEEAGDVG